MRVPFGRVLVGALTAAIGLSFIVGAHALEGRGVSRVAATAAPTDIAPASDGSLWVTDASGGYVLKVTPAGLTVDRFPLDGSPLVMRNPQAVAVDSAGRVYAADTDNHRIVVFDVDGDVVRTIGEYGTGDGQLRSPAGVAIDSSGSVWVSDTNNNRIQRFSSSGTFQQKYSSFTGYGTLGVPRGLAISGTSLYVTDAANRRILKVNTSTGSVLAQWGIIPGTPDTPTTSRYLTPTDVCIISGSAYVVDMGAAAAELVTESTGLRVSAWGTSGSADTSFTVPQGVWADASNVWVADTGNGRLVKYSLTGTYLSKMTVSSDVVDLAPPVTTSTVTGIWRSTPETVALTAVDARSGVDRTEYRIGAGTTTTYTAPFAVDGSGEVTVTYWSTDKAGNVETAKSSIVRLDKGSPVTTSSITGAWRSSVETVSLVATDTQSGVSITRYRIGSGLTATYTAPFAVDGSGEVTVTYWSWDKAGNTEATRSAVVRIDRTPPVSNSSATGSWRVSTETVTISATDVGAGMNRVEYRLNGSGWTGVPGAGASVLVGAEGVNTVEYRGVDAVGNVEPTRTAYVRIDRTAPESTSTASGVWTNGAATVLLSSTDAGSGVASVEYRVGAGDWTPYSGAFTVDGDGETPIQFRASDAVGNAELTKTSYVRIDRTPPSTATSLGDIRPDGKRTVALSATDGQSGVAVSYYRIDGGVITPYAAPLVLAAFDPLDLEYWSVDAAGNVEPAGALRWTGDITPPMTNATGLDGAWRSTGATISISATDSESGVEATYYRLGINGMTMPYTGPVSVTTEGVTQVTYWSVDRKGNVELVRTGYVRIDRTAPASTSNITGVWRRTSQSVTLSATDGGSGVASIEYRTGEGAYQPYSGAFPVIADGETVVRFRATDAVGNVETATVATVRIDRTAPLSSSSALGEWRATPETVTLSAVETGSGLNRINYRIGFTGLRTYSGPFVIDTEGEHQIAFYGTDNAGNVEAMKSCFVRIDRLPPATLASVSDIQQDNTRIITLAATDGGSGVAHTYYSVNGGPTNEYTAPFSLPLAESTIVEFWSVDVLGRVEGTQRITLADDFTPPITSVSPVLDGAWRKLPIQVSLQATDSGSGVSGTYYRLNDSVETTYVTPFDVAAEGETKVSYWSVDNDGFREAEKTGWVRIDRVAPDSSANVDYNDFQSRASLTLSAADAGSGLGYIEYRPQGATSWDRYSGAIPFSSAGVRIIEFRAVDALGNTEAPNSVIISLRELVPNTSAFADDLPLGSAWYPSDVTVRLSASCEGTAPISTYYRVGAGGVTAYSGSFTVSGEGEIPVSYWSEADGVREATRTAMVRIDRTAPSTTYSQVIGSSPTRVVVTLTAVDPVGSGVDRVYYRYGSAQTWSLYDGPFTVDRASMVWYRAVDRVGNQEVAQFRAIPPSTRTNRSSTAWYRYNPSVSLIATHPAGATLTTYFNYSGQTGATSYAGPFTVYGDGLKTIRYWSVAAGTTEATQTLTLHIDKTKPAMTSLWSPTHPSSTTTYRSRTVRFTWRGYDKTSGVRGYAYKIDRAKYTVPSSSARTTSATSVYRRLSSGTWYIHVRAVDKAGNWGATKHFRVRIR